MKITLKSEEGSNKVTHEFETVSLVEMIEQFELFLKANGFSYNGSLEISYYEDEKEN